MALKQTKGYSNFKGIISGLHNRKKGSSKQTFEWGTTLTFFLKTSEYNSIPVTLVSFNSRIGKSVYFSTKTDDGYETKEIDWKNRNDKYEGWNLIGINLKSKNQEETISLVEHDAIDFILDNFNDGDSVFVGTEMKRSAKGDKVYTNYNIRKMFATSEPVDFESEDFAEISEFQEEFVFNDIFEDKKSGKAFVKGQTIAYNDDVTDVMYVVNLNIDEDKALAKYLATNVSFGDVLSVTGIVHNRTIGDWIENEDNQPLVGRSTNSFSKPDRQFVVTGEQKELQIIGIESVQKGLYSKAELEGSSDDDDTPSWLK